MREKKEPRFVEPYKEQLFSLVEFIVFFIYRIFYL